MIYISTVSKRGSSHHDWNEDNFYIIQTANTIIGGVFDGCSSGVDSYFASKLFANVFRSTIGQAKEMICIKKFPFLVHSYVKNLHQAIETIGLSMEETLSTAILFIYEIDTQTLHIKFFGDGVAYSNQSELEICVNDEANQPDYLGYSIKNLLDSHKFKAYWDHKKSFHTQTKDFTISTDGIFSFKKFDPDGADFDIESYLVKDLFLYKNSAALKRKLNILQHNGYQYEDDVTLIRVIVDDLDVAIPKSSKR